MMVPIPDGWGHQNKGKMSFEPDSLFSVTIKLGHENKFFSWQIMYLISFSDKIMHQNKKLKISGYLPPTKK